MSSGMHGLGTAPGTLLTTMLTDRQDRHLSFLLWHMGSSSRFNAVSQEALQILLPPEASAGHQHWAKIAMNDGSRMLKRLPKKEGVWLSALDCLRSLKLALGSPYPAPFWTTRLPTTSCTQHPPSYLPPSCGHTPSIAPESLRPAGRSSLSPLSLLTREGQWRSHLVRPLVEKHRA